MEKVMYFFQYRCIILFIRSDAYISSEMHRKETTYGNY